MKQFGGWMFPDHEVHLLEWLSHPKNIGDVVDGRTMYQGKKQRLAIDHCRNFRVAIDCGAHCGTWSWTLAKHFDVVHAFEPVADHRECFAVNVPAPNVILYPCALGDREGSISMHTSTGSSGDSWVKGEGDIPMHRIDSYGFSDVDLIKIDCEGGELPVLRGAEETLLRCQPVVIVEQKPGHAQRFGFGETAAVDYLQSLGATLKARKAGDFVLAWS